MAPIVPALIPSTFSYLNHAYNPVAVFIAFCGAFYVLQLAVGVPTYKYLRLRNKHNLVTYLAVGLISIEVPFLVLVALRWSARHYTILSAIYPTIYIGILGALPPLIFWLLVRPDKSSPDQKLIADQFE